MAEKLTHEFYKYFSERINSFAYMQILNSNPPMPKCQFLFQCCLFHLETIRILEGKLIKKQRGWDKIASQGGKVEKLNDKNQEIENEIRAAEGKLDALIDFVVAHPNNIIGDGDFRDYVFLVSTPAHVEAVVRLRKMNLWTANLVKAVNPSRALRAACSVEEIMCVESETK